MRIWDRVHVALMHLDPDCAVHFLLRDTGRTLDCDAIQSHVALVCRLKGLRLSNACKYMDYYSIIDPGGMEG